MNENSFFSMDRLLEFGLSMEMARQMMGVMNQSFSQMQIPSAKMPDGSNASKVISTMDSRLLYHVVIDGKSTGPYNEQELTQLIQNKKLTNDSFVWQPGFTDWKRAEEVPEVLKLVALSPPPVPQK